MSFASARLAARLLVLLLPLMGCGSDSTPARAGDTGPADTADAGPDDAVDTDPADTADADPADTDSDDAGPAVDITGDWLILRYHFTDEPGRTPLRSELDEVRFVQQGDTFTQYFGADDEVGVEGTIVDGEYVQTDGDFTARLRFEDADHGSGTYEQGAFTTSFDLVRVGAAEFDVVGDWLADDGTDTPVSVTVALAGDALTVEIAGQTFSGRLGGDVGLLLGDPQPADGALAANIRWRSEAEAVATRYESSWTPNGDGHTGYSEDETVLTLSRPVIVEGCAPECDVTARCVERVCEPRVEGSPCAADEACPGQLYCGPDDLCHDGGEDDPCARDAQCAPTGRACGEDGRCRDVDECATDNGGCDQICLNAIGTFTCDCEAGFRLNEDGATCDALAPMALPVTFDDPGVFYVFTDFEGASSASAEDPTEAANTVASTTKTSGAETFAGTTLALATPIPFSATDTSLSVRVFSPGPGLPVRLKIEDAPDPATVFSEVQVETTLTEAWETLVFDFSAPVLGTAVDLDVDYVKVIIFFDFGTAGDGATYLWDDVEFVGCGSGRCDDDENWNLCPIDCEGVCGDAVCDAGEQGVTPGDAAFCAEDCRVTVIFELDANSRLPGDSEGAWIVGNQPALGEWDPNTIALRDDGSDPDRSAADNVFTGAFVFDPGTSLEYKYTIGAMDADWAGTEEYAGGSNRAYAVPADGIRRVRISDVWGDQPAAPGELGASSTITLEDAACVFDDVCDDPRENDVTCPSQCLALGDPCSGDEQCFEAGLCRDGLCSVPTTCDEAHGEVGCCLNGDLFWFEGGTLMGGVNSCGGGEECGWDASNGFYACAFEGADPSGTYPIDCFGVNPAPEDCNCDCADRVCGDDGCGGSCGPCDDETFCAPIGQCVPLGTRVCIDPRPNDECALPDACDCVTCVDDGACTIADDCVCADCASEGVCTSRCNDDNVCDIYNEGCACGDCAGLPICAS